MSVNKIRKLTGIVLLLAGFAALIPGVTQPILLLQAQVDKAQLVELGKQELASNPDIPPFLLSLSIQLIDDLQIEGNLEVMNKSRSIIDTVETLSLSGRWVVAILIALFSMTIPGPKLVLLLFGTLLSNSRTSRAMKQIQNAIGKWSMADVFVIAIMVAYLAAIATQDMGEVFSLDAQFGSGFYYFLAYCLLSIFASQLLNPAAHRRPEE
jgi:hypothetical protein